MARGLEEEEDRFSAVMRTVSMVYYRDNGQWVTVEAIDADRGGEVGEILVDDFSRWAWWR